jgi:hypothetical protein
VTLKTFYNVGPLVSQRLKAGNGPKRPKALKDKPDKTFYLGYDFMNKNNPAFHHEEQIL